MNTQQQGTLYEVRVQMGGGCRNSRDVGERLLPTWKEKMRRAAAGGRDS